MGWHEENVYSRLQSLKEKLHRTEETAKYTLQVLDNAITKTILKDPELILWENKIRVN
jgi:hypothetical protein